HAIAAALRVPVDVLDLDAVGERAAQALGARELVEPGLELRVGETAVVTGQRWSGNERARAQRDARDSRPDKSVHVVASSASSFADQERGPSDLEHAFAHSLHVV